MKRHLSDSSEPENCDDYDDCSSPDTVQTSRKKRRGVIEKRRRDRINNCLVELRSLVPAAFEKQGSAKLEKAEILQMTVEHLRYLQNRDPRGFSDPCSPCINTKAFLDYGIMGFRECTAEIARFMASTQGMDPKDVSRTRLVNHLENVISQKELAVNTAIAVNSQMNISKVGSPPLSIMSMASAPPLATSISYAPLTPPRASPDNLSPLGSLSGTTFGIADSLPHFSVAFPIPTTPIISLAPSTNRSVSAAIFQPSGLKPVIPVTQAMASVVPCSVVKPAPLINGLPRPTAQPPTAPMSAIKTSPLTPTSPPNFTVWAEPNNLTLTTPKLSTKAMNISTKAPFRPWADSTTLTTNA